MSKGNSCGIGKAIALALAEAAAAVAVKYRERGNDAGAAVEAIRNVKNHRHAD